MQLTFYNEPAEMPYERLSHRKSDDTSEKGNKPMELMVIKPEKPIFITAIPLLNTVVSCDRRMIKNRYY